MVNVLSLDWKPLSPCSDAKARHLMKQHRAYCVKNNPYTIRLKFPVEEGGGPHPATSDKADPDKERQADMHFMIPPKSPGSAVLETPLDRIHWKNRWIMKRVELICIRNLGGRYLSECQVKDLVKIPEFCIPSRDTNVFKGITETLEELGLHFGMTETELDIYRVTYKAEELLEKCTACKTAAKNRGVSVKVNAHGGPLPDNQGGKGDWYDLYVAEDVDMKAGEFRLISMGVSIEVPEGYTAYMLPRSSTFKKFGLLQTNSMGVIDSSYCGDNDIIRFPALATRDVHISKGDRIAQLTVMPTSSITWIPASTLEGKDRGGFGTTGQ